MTGKRVFQRAARLLLVYLQERCLELMAGAAPLFVRDTVVIVILDCIACVQFDEINFSSDEVIQLGRVLMLDCLHLLLARRCGLLGLAVAWGLSCLICLVFCRLSLIIGRQV